MLPSPPADGPPALVRILHDLLQAGASAQARELLCGLQQPGLDLSGLPHLLHGADLRGTFLRNARLCGTTLMEADLSGADLSGADLRRASLYLADLRGADLSGADLRQADLAYADLRGARLVGARLDGARAVRAGTRWPVGADTTGVCWLEDALRA